MGDSAVLTRWVRDGLGDLNKAPYTRVRRIVSLIKRPNPKRSAGIITVTAIGLCNVIFA